MTSLKARSRKTAAEACAGSRDSRLSFSPNDREPHSWAFRGEVGGEGDADFTVDQFHRLDDPIVRERVVYALPGDARGASLARVVGEAQQEQPPARRGDVGEPLGVALPLLADKNVKQPAVDDAAETPVPRVEG